MTQSPTLSILIPTKGGGDLLYVLQTISTQELIEGDEVLIVCDGPQPEIMEQVNALGPPFRYAQTERPTGDFGHSQLNLGLSLATGDYIMCTDDDDGYLPRAIECVRAALIENPDKPHLFKFWTNERYLVWNEAYGKKIEETKVGGHNLVLPNVAGKKGAFSKRYRGDFDWIKSVLSCYPENDWVWRSEILTRQRPSPKLMAWPVWKRSLNDLNLIGMTWHPERLEGMRLIRNECRLEMTHSQNEISPEQQVEWANGLDRNENWAWLYTVKDGDPKDYVGFTYIRHKTGVMVPSYGIAEKFRGQGYAKHIAQHMIDAFMGDGEADIWESNVKSLQVFSSVGWRETGRENGLVQLRYPYPL